jgi:hypothetical protein
MSEELQVFDFRDEASLRLFADATYQNEEPGFQIDNVRNWKELYSVFGILETALPEHERAMKYGAATLHLGALGQASSPPHTDGGKYGLGVHQNMTGDYPVTLATSLVGLYEARDYIINPVCATNLRHGTNKPGRLTVFSQGGFDWLQPTIHFFDRRQQQDQNNWARYELSVQKRRDVKKTVDIVFSRLGQQRAQDEAQLATL